MQLTHRIGRYFGQLMQDDKRRLIQFSIAAIFFFAAYGMLYWTNKQPPSLQQELTALFFLALCGLSFFWAILLQILYIFAKVTK